MKRRVISLAMIAILVLIASPIKASAADSGDYVGTNNQQILQQSAEKTLGNLSMSGTRAGTFIVNTDGVRIRATPSLSGTVVGLLYRGDLVTHPHGVYPDTEADGYTWKYIFILSGPSGWVADIYLDEYGE